jgi:hypothetical protein
MYTSETSRGVDTRSPGQRALTKVHRLPPRRWEKLERADNGSGGYIDGFKTRPTTAAHPLSFEFLLETTPGQPEQFVVLETQGGRTTRTPVSTEHCLSEWRTASGFWQRLCEEVRSK